MLVLLLDDKILPPLGVPPDERSNTGPITPWGKPVPSEQGSRNGSSRHQNSSHGTHWDALVSCDQQHLPRRYVFDDNAGDDPSPETGQHQGIRDKIR